VDLCRNGRDFWFSAIKNPYCLPVPTDKGPAEEAILYEANRTDPDIKFTREACKQLTGVPSIFLGVVLKGIVKKAKERGVTEVDEAFVKQLNEERNGGGGGGSQSDSSCTIL